MSDEPKIQTLRLARLLNLAAIADCADNPLPALAADLIKMAYAKFGREGVTITDFKITLGRHVMCAADVMHQPRGTVLDHALVIVAHGVDNGPPTCPDCKCCPDGHQDFMRQAITFGVSVATAKQILAAVPMPEAIMLLNSGLYVHPAVRDTELLVKALASERSL